MDKKFGIRAGLLTVTLSLTCMAQYVGMPGTATAAGTTGAYSPAGKSYGHGALIGAAVGGGVGAGLLYMTLRHRATVVGCVEPDGTLVSSKNSKSYTLVNDGTSSFQPGQRIEVHGKAKGSSLLVHNSKELGSCTH